MYTEVLSRSFAFRDALGGRLDCRFLGSVAFLGSGYDDAVTQSAECAVTGITTVPDLEQALSQPSKPFFPDRANSDEGWKIPVQSYTFSAMAQKSKLSSRGEISLRTEEADALRRMLKLHLCGWLPLPTFGLQRGGQFMVLPTDGTRPWQLCALGIDLFSQKRAATNASWRMCRFYDPKASSQDRRYERVAHDYYGPGDSETMAWRLAEVVQANTLPQRTIVCSDACLFSMIHVDRPAPTDLQTTLTCVMREGESFTFQVSTLVLVLQLMATARHDFMSSVLLPTLDHDIPLDPATAKALHILLMGSA